MCLPKVSLLQAQSWESNPGLLGESLLILSVHPLYSSLSHVFSFSYTMVSRRTPPCPLELSWKKRKKKKHDYLANLDCCYGQKQCLAWLVLTVKFSFQIPSNTEMWAARRFYVPSILVTIAEFHSHLESGLTAVATHIPFRKHTEMLQPNLSFPRTSYP